MGVEFELLPFQASWNGGQGSVNQLGCAVNQFICEIRTGFLKAEDLHVLQRGVRVTLGKSGEVHCGGLGEVLGSVPCVTPRPPTAPPGWVSRPP